jgi:hypothetical protein
MERHFTQYRMNSKSGVGSFFKKIMILAIVLMTWSASAGTLYAANFEIDSVNELPDGMIYDDYILYARLSPVRGSETDTCINGGFALSETLMTTWSDYSCFIRFDNIDKKSYIDVRDNASTPNMVALDTIYFDFDEVFDCWFDIHFYDQTYDVYVQAPGETEPVLIAENAAFRKTPVDILAYFHCVRNGDYTQTTAHVQVLDVHETNMIGLPVGTENITAGNIEGISLDNFPNPFSGKTTIKYSLQQGAPVNITIFDLNGREVMTVVNEFRESGEYNVILGDGRLNKGLYFCRLRVNDRCITRKIILQ